MAPFNEREVSSGSEPMPRGTPAEALHLCPMALGSPASCDALVHLADSVPVHLPGQLRAQGSLGSPAIQAVQTRRLPQPSTAFTLDQLAGPLRDQWSGY